MTTRFTLKTSDEARAAAQFLFTAYEGVVDDQKWDDADSLSQFLSRKLGIFQAVSTGMKVFLGIPCNTTEAQALLGGLSLIAYANASDSDRETVRGLLSGSNATGEEALTEHEFEANYSEWNNLRALVGLVVESNPRLEYWVLPIRSKGEILIASSLSAGPIRISAQKAHRDSRFYIDYTKGLWVEQYSSCDESQKLYSEWSRLKYAEKTYEHLNQKIIEIFFGFAC